MAHMAKNQFTRIAGKAKTGMLIEKDGAIFYADTLWQQVFATKTPALLQSLKEEETDGEGLLRLENSDGNVYELCHRPGVDPAMTVWLLTDVSGENRLKAENGMLKEIIDHVDEAVIITDKEGIITLYNRAHELLDHTTAVQVLGQRVNQVYQKEMHSQVAQTKRPVKDFYHTYLLKDGRQINTLSSTMPMWSDGEFQGVSSISRDITFSKNLIRRISDLQSRVAEKRGALPNGTRFTLDDIIGESPVMKKAKADAAEMALSPSPLLLYGETGTGKELFAQSIHNAGMYSDEPFIAVNCAAIPENLLESTLFGTEKGSFTGAEKSVGLLEQAGKGTFFLDEINSMPLSMQPKLLRVVQERKLRRIGGVREISIHCRFISSCNQLPEKCVESNALRMDLFYRLAVLRIEIPPLRERGGDIILLAKYFAEKIGALYGDSSLALEDDFLTYLRRNPWPGNVRELEFTIEGCIASIHDSSALSTKNIPHYLTTLGSASGEKHPGLPPSTTTKSLREILDTAELEAIRVALTRNGGNISKAARDLGIGRQNLQYRIKKLHLKADSH